MDLIIVVAALGLLMTAAYRGYSVVLFAPIAALGAVLLTVPAAVAPVFAEVFMPSMVQFLKLYFPVFMLGAIFGKVIEISGFSPSLAGAIIALVGHQHAILAIVLVCALLTYGGVSLFVVVFAVYPFAAEMFRRSEIPKRLIPGTIALGAFTFTMSSLPGSPQIQNIIPSGFFGTTTWAAPWLGLVGAIFTLACGMLYLQWRCNGALAAKEGYASGMKASSLKNEPEPFNDEALPHPMIALLPLLVVGVTNLALTQLIPRWYGADYAVTLPGQEQPIPARVEQWTAIWAVLGALLAGIVTVIAFAFRTVAGELAEGSRAAVAGALLAAMNTASEYGFGAVIAVLPGFAAVAAGLALIEDPLVGEAIAVTTLAGITGSASGGMSIALAAMSEGFISSAEAAGIPMEVLHRVAAMASGGMDTLPHNGAVITLLAVTGLTHRQSYRDIFAITLIATAAVLVVIAVHYLTGLV